METANSLDRKVYLDILRIVAVMGTVMIHVACMNWGDALYNSRAWDMMNLFNAISRFSVPVFLMISGALTLNKPYSYKTAIDKVIHKIINILTWGVIYSVWSCSINPGFKYDDYIKCILSGYGHMWYLWLTIGITILQPAIRKLAIDKSVMLYIICVLFVATCLLPSFFELFNYFHCTNEYVNAVIDAIKNNLNNSSLTSLSYYILYYLLGFYISDYKSDHKNSRYLIICGVLLFASSAATYLVSRFLSNQEADKVIIYGNYQISVFIQSVSLFCIFRITAHYFENANTFIKKALAGLSELC